MMLCTRQIHHTALLRRLLVDRMTLDVHARRRKERFHQLHMQFYMRLCASQLSRCILHVRELLQNSSHSPAISLSIFVEEAIR